MTNPQIQNDPVITLPFLYKTGLIISNDATTPNTVLDIAQGQCRDSNDIMDITLGANNPNLEGNTVAAPLKLNAAVNGVNGLDTGSLAASTMYAVYMIADSRYYKPVASILTLASNTAPLVPFGYDSYRLIGYWPTDSSSHFLLGYVTGTANSLSFFYDAPQASNVTAGASTSYAAASLANIVPAVNNLSVLIQSVYTPHAAADTLKMQPGNGTCDMVTIEAPSTNVLYTDSALVSQLVTGVPTINYKVSSGTSPAAVAINVRGYTYSV